MHSCCLIDGDTAHIFFAGIAGNRLNVPNAKAFFSKLMAEGIVVSTTVVGNAIMKASLT